MGVLAILFSLEAFTLCTVGAVIWISIQRLLLSPISKLPGPWYLKLSSLFFKYHEFKGTKRLWIHNLHHLYGPVLALGPRYAHFASATAVKTMYITGSKAYVKTEFYDLFRQEGHVYVSHITLSAPID